MPRLVLQKGVGAGRDHALGGDCVVGRQPGVTFPIDDKLASRHHFRVFQDAGRWVVEDLHSTNGTRVNGVRIERHALADGDVISAGTTELLFVQKDLLGGKGPATPGVVAPPVLKPPATAPAKGKGVAPVRRRKRRYR
ncbi:MAG: FHA domain-containing protein [Planctomycetota bacterium]|jgi:pSer/pThr/pTyr-binding forkhead associated (FHA) protein